MPFFIFEKKCGAVSDETHRRISFFVRCILSECRNDREGHGALNIADRDLISANRGCIKFVIAICEYCFTHIAKIFCLMFNQITLVLVGSRSNGQRQNLSHVLWENSGTVTGELGRTHTVTHNDDDERTTVIKGDSSGGVRILIDNTTESMFMTSNWSDG